MNDFSVGRVVLSKMGRDKGSFYLITKLLDTNYAEIADGDIRKIERPKKKKLMHLTPTDKILLALKGKIESGKAISNKELIDALLELNSPKNMAEDK